LSKEVLGPDAVRFHTLGEARVISCRLIVLAALAVTWSQAILAQTTGNSARVGDQWTFNRKDEITGLLKDTYTVTVTEITPQQIVASIAVKGQDPIVAAYNHDWNQVAAGPWKYKPHAGPGIHLPLEMGKEWQFEYFENNAVTNAKIKVSNVTKVTGQEIVKTPAGTFAAFKVERQTKAFNVAAPSQLRDQQIVLWYAPDANHVIRRTVLTKIDKRTNSSTSEELIAFSRKQ